MKSTTLIGLLAGLIACAHPARSADVPAWNPTNAIPLIQFHDVPFTTGIENLARQAEINYLPAPDLFVDAQGNPVGEPTIDCEWKNVAARDALTRICDENGLDLVENPYTHIARLVRAGQPRRFIDASLLGLSTNQPAASAGKNTNDIPLIQFSDVPLDLAFMSLIKQSGRPIELSSNLMENVEQSVAAPGTVTFHQLSVTKSPWERDGWFKSMPLVSARWENVTCEQAIAALCENYDLEIVTDAETGNLEIMPRKVKRHHRTGH